MTTNAFTVLLTTTDWNEEWKRLQKARQHYDSAAIWDRKAKTFPVKHGSQQGYVEEFLKRAAVENGERVLDMGCGTGALATPLLQAGHEVIACDFSQGMLDAMRADMESLGVAGADIHLMSWDDDWEAHGIARDCVDVAFASRSIATYDLREALLKLHDVARRRVCITLPASLSPKVDPELLAAAGFSSSMGRDFLYAFNILASEGIMPEVSYIPNPRLEVFESFDAALASFSDIVRNAVKGLADDGSIAQIPQRLEPWLRERIVRDDSGFHLSSPRDVSWAFIAWSTR